MMLFLMTSMWLVSTAVAAVFTRCCASGFFADELPSWPGSGFPKRVSASVAVFFFACVDKDR